VTQINAGDVLVSITYPYERDVCNILTVIHKSKIPQKTLVLLASPPVN